MDGEEIVRTAQYASNLDFTPARQVQIVATCEAALAKSPSRAASVSSTSDHDRELYATEAALRTAIDAYVNTRPEWDATTEESWDAYVYRTGYVPDGTRHQAIYNSFVVASRRASVAVLGGDPHLTSHRGYLECLCRAAVDRRLPCFSTIYGASGAVGWRSSAASPSCQLNDCYLRALLHVLSL